jgi:GT2 family glycosyltransferase
LSSPTTAPDHAVIGYVRPVLVYGEFSESLLSVAMEGATPLDAVLRYESGPNISTPRNLVVDDFLRRYEAPWLLMVDTDMVFAGDALDRLVAAADPVERPLVGALCYSPAAGEVRPTMYEITQNAAGELGFAHREAWPEGACVRVSATGTGFLLMHRDALEAVRKHSGDVAAPWFRESPVGAPLSLMGEDMTFCLRAGAAGIPVHVATSVKVGHLKPQMLGTVT